MKVLTTLAIGTENEALEAITGPYREAWAEAHGWVYQPITKLDAILTIPHREGRSRGWHIQLGKLKLPAYFERSADLVCFMDCDTILRPAAPDLPALDPGKWGSAVTTTPEERATVFPEWLPTFYDEPRMRVEFSEPGERAMPPINGGLLLFRPSEFVEKWSELVLRDSDATDDNRLNLWHGNALQYLDRRWNVVWRYERRRAGLSGPYHTKLARARTRLKEAVCAPRINRLFHATLERSYMVHFQQESRDIEKWMRTIERA